MMTGRPESGVTPHILNRHRHPTGKNQGLFNNAAQVFNHEFYWNCMKKGGGGAATGKVAELINRDFGSFDAFKVRS